MDNLTVKVIARIYTDFGEKFGVPRQSGLVPELTGKIIFEPEYRVPEALSGIEGYSWLWLLWGFSESPRNNGHRRCVRQGWEATKKRVFLPHVLLSDRIR